MSSQSSSSLRHPLLRQHDAPNYNVAPMFSVMRHAYMRKTVRSFGLACCNPVLHRLLSDHVWLVPCSRVRYRCSSFGPFGFSHIFSECQSGWCVWMESHEASSLYGGDPLFSFGLVYSSMLVIFLGQCMPSIFLRCLLWEVVVHSSLL